MKRRLCFRAMQRALKELFRVQQRMQAVQDRKIKPAQGHVEVWSCVAGNGCD